MSMFGEGRNSVSSDPADSWVAISLLAGFDATGNLVQLDFAISHLRRLVADRSRVGERAAFQFTLGQALYKRYLATGALGDLEWSVRHMKSAVENTSYGDPKRGKRLQNLAESLLTAVECMEPGEAPRLVCGHLDYADGILSESLALADESRLASCRSSYGISAMLRFQHFGDSDELDRAVGVFSTACGEVVTLADIATCNGNLGKCLMLKYDTTRAPTVLNAAVDAFRAALDAAPLDAPDYEFHRRHLRLALEYQVEAGGDPRGRPEQ